MRKPVPLPAGARESLEQLLKKVKTKTQFQRVQCLWLRAALGLSSHDVALAIGWRASSVRHLQAQYLKEGEPVLEASKRGGRYRANMTADEERLFSHLFLRSLPVGKYLW